MSDEGDSKQALAAPATPARAPVTNLLLHVRYVFGYLAGGFLVSVPFALGSRVMSGNGSAIEAAKEVALSVGYGGALLIPFLGLWPFTRIDWKAMNVPEFQLFELKVTRTAAVVALVLLGLSLELRVMTQTQVADPWLCWTVFLLMLFAWGRIKVQTRLFPEFYASSVEKR